jgi:hypothetical protein
MTNDWLLDCHKCGRNIAGKPSSKPRPPLLVEMADPSGPYMAALAKFRHRTCVAMIGKDGAVHPSAGLIRRECQIQKGPETTPGIKSFWGFGPRDGVDEPVAFEEGLVEARHQRLPDGPDDIEVETKRSCTYSQLLVCGANGCQHLQEWKLSGLDLCLRMRCNRCGSRAGTWRVATEEDRDTAANAGLSADLTWERSSDGALFFPTRVLMGLDSVAWRRIPVFYHIRHHWSLNWLMKLRGYMDSDVFYNGHVFLLGKKNEQVRGEHRMAQKCIEHLVRTLEG